MFGTRGDAARDRPETPRKVADCGGNVATVVHLGDGLRGLGLSLARAPRPKKLVGAVQAASTSGARAVAGSIERVHEESIGGRPEWLSERIEQARHLLRFMEDFARPLRVAWSSARGG